MSEVLWIYPLLRKYQAYLSVLSQIEKDCIGNHSMIECRVKQLIPADEASEVIKFENILWKIGSCAGDWKGVDYLDWDWEYVGNDTTTLSPDEVEERNLEVLCNVLDKENKLLEHYYELFKIRYSGDGFSC